MTRVTLLIALTLSAASPAAAQSLVVVEARGVELKLGSRLEEGRTVKVPAGGKVVLVRGDGQVISLRGPHNGPIKAQTAQSQSPGRALAALVATRNDRANRIGAVRSGANAAPLSSPWLVDVSRPGERCLIEGTPIRWWRPESAKAARFTLFPLDRSWKATFAFESGQDQLALAKVGDIDGSKAFIIQDQDREYGIRFHLIPASVKEPAILAGWMIEKGCIQQADALFAALGKDPGGVAGE